MESNNGHAFLSTTVYTCLTKCTIIYVFMFDMPESIHVIGDFFHTENKIKKNKSQRRNPYILLKWIPNIDEPWY